MYQEEEKDKLKICIEQYEKRVNNLLKTLGWTIEGTLKDRKSNNQLSKFREQINDKNDPLYPDTIVAKNFCIFDNETLQQFFNTANKKRNLPQKFSDFQITFNREEKLALYQYVIDKTGKLTEPEVSVLTCNENEDASSSNKHMTFSEIVAMRRDEKRRRLKYRTTKTPPLTVTEELKHLIEIQMQAYDQFLKHSSTSNHNQLSNNEPGSHRGNSSKEHKSKRNKSHKHKTSHKHKKYKKKVIKQLKYI